MIQCFQQWAVDLHNLLQQDISESGQKFQSQGKEEGRK